MNERRGARATKPAASTTPRIRRGNAAAGSIAQKIATHGCVVAIASTGKYRVAFDPIDSPKPVWE
jgi:hypothetical protein